MYTYMYTIYVTYNEIALKNQTILFHERMQSPYFQWIIRLSYTIKKLPLVISCLVIINYVIIIIEKGHPMSCVELDLTSTCVTSKLLVS